MLFRHTNNFVIVLWIGLWIPLSIRLFDYVIFVVWLHHLLYIYKLHGWWSISVKITDITLQLLNLINRIILFLEGKKKKIKKSKHVTWSLFNHIKNWILYCLNIVSKHWKSRSDHSVWWNSCEEIGMPRNDKVIKSWPRIEISSFLKENAAYNFRHGLNCAHWICENI